MWLGRNRKNQKSLALDKANPLANLSKIPNPYYQLNWPPTQLANRSYQAPLFLPASVSLLRKLGKIGNMGAADGGNDIISGAADEMVDFGAPEGAPAENITAAPAPPREVLLELIEDKTRLRNWIALRLMEESTLCPTTSGRLKALSQLSELCLVDERTKYRVENKSDSDFNIIVVSERLEQARQLKLASVNKLTSLASPPELPSPN